MCENQSINQSIWAGRQLQGKGIDRVLPSLLPPKLQHFSQAFTARGDAGAPVAPDALACFMDGVCAGCQPPPRTAFQRWRSTSQSKLLPQSSGINAPRFFILFLLCGIDNFVVETLALFWVVVHVVITISQGPGSETRSTNQGEHTRNLLCVASCVAPLEQTDGKDSEQSKYWAGKKIGFCRSRKS